MPAKLVALILLGLTLTLLVSVDNQWPGSASAQIAKSWLYLNAFQSRKLTAIDPTTGRVEDTIDVDDAGGSLGAAVTSDGKTIITADGSLKSRLRMFKAATLELMAEHAFDHRVL
jgi:glutamine cyclotransferase